MAAALTTISVPLDLKKILPEFKVFVIRGVELICSEAGDCCDNITEP